MDHGKKISTEDMQNRSSIDMACYSSSTLKRNEEIKKDQGTSTDPSLNNQKLEQVSEFLICYRFVQIV